MDHKPLEWLAMVSYSYGQKGHWIDMLQDFNFKIIHWPRSKHSNVDAFNHNLVGNVEFHEDFSEEIQDISFLQEMGI
jgi:hypothetical protein